MEKARVVDWDDFFFLLALVALILLMISASGCALPDVIAGAADTNGDGVLSNEEIQAAGRTVGDFAGGVLGLGGLVDGIAGALTVAGLTGLEVLRRKRKAAKV